MRNKFTKQAQTALTLAKAAAIDFELGYIGTEHLVLGLLSEQRRFWKVLWQRHRILAVRRPERSICSLPCSARRTVLEPGFYIRWE